MLREKAAAGGKLVIRSKKNRGEELQGKIALNRSKKAPGRSATVGKGGVTRFKKTGDIRKVGGH